MTDQAKSKLDLFLQKTDGTVGKGETTAEQIERVSNAADAVGLETHFGWISHAGRVADGTYQVQFDAPGSGWSSRWPDWAYEAALPAVIHKKKVYVVSDGPPFGMNLLFVLIFLQDA